MANEHAKKAAEVAAEQWEHTRVGAGTEGFSETTPSQDALLDWYNQHGHAPESKKAVRAARAAGIIPDAD